MFSVNASVGLQMISWLCGHNSTDNQEEDEKKYFFTQPIINSWNSLSLGRVMPINLGLNPELSSAHGMSVTWMLVLQMCCKARSAWAVKPYHLCCPSAHPALGRIAWRQQCNTDGWWVWGCRRYTLSGRSRERVTRWGRGGVGMVPAPTFAVGSRLPCQAAWPNTKAFRSVLAK